MALDLCRDQDLKAPGLQPAWDAAAFKILVEEVEREGLHSGKSYQDLPHVSWPGYVSGSDLAPLRSIWTKTATQPLQAKLKAVWAEVARTTK